MKSAIFAAASIAAVASANEARAPLQLGLNVGNLVNVDLCLGLDVKLPLGISIETDGCPSAPPPSGRTNIWHPPHHVNMDGCDNNDESGWHYVHPCNCVPSAPPHTWATSTIIETRVSTIISCAPEVANCPGRTTIVVPATTTICPVPVTTTTLATIPATTSVAVPPTQPASVTQQPPVTQPPPATQQPPVTQGPSVPQQPPATQQPPVSQAPPASQQPPASLQPPVSQGPPASQAPPAYPQPPASQQPPVCQNNPCPTAKVPVGTGSYAVPPPVGTGYPAPGGNTTKPPPVIAGASINGQNAAVAAVVGLAAALLI